MNDTEKLELVKRNLNIISASIEDEKENISFEDIDKLIKVCVNIIEN